jgi:hypothetical protein
LTNEIGDSNPQKRDVTLSNVLSLKDRAYAFLNLHHDLKPKILCQLLQIPYNQNKGYVRKLRYKWKRDFKNGLPSKSPSSQHNCRAYCYVPESVDRKAALEVGWTLSKNRNRVLVFKDAQYGRVEWWETRRVVVHINKPQTLGRVKQFLSNAFFKNGLIWDDRLFNPWIESVQWLGAHDVYETAEKLPYAVIDTYRDTIGFVFKSGDLSHQNSYEFEWCKPSWMERFELLSRQAILNLEQNGKIVETDSKALLQTNALIQQFTELMRDLARPKLEPKDRKDPMLV